MAEDQAFVVMQVGGKESSQRKRADEIFEFVVKPALVLFKLKPYRADLDPSPGGITSKMLTELLGSRLVIADLTGRNPNVFYELGIAHSFARPLITIAEATSSLPFDAKDERIIELGAYAESGLTYAQGETAKRNLVASLEIVLAEGYKPPSPLREVAGSQSLDALAPENPFASELGQMRETIQEIRQMVTPRTRAIVPRSMRADLAIMKKALEVALDSGAVSFANIPSLIDEETSQEHDAWVGELSDRFSEQSAMWETPLDRSPDQRGSRAQDPWASGASAANDEPPF